MSPNKTDPTQTRHLRLGPSDIEIGRFTYGFETIRIIHGNEGRSLRIGQFCSIADGVTIFLGNNHRTDWVTTYPFGHIFQDELGGEDIQGHPYSNGDVQIGNDVGIGQGASIMSGVTIGDGAVVAARAHVTRDVMPYEIVGGNPALIIRDRFRRSYSYLLRLLAWWDLPIDEIRTIAPRISGTLDIQELRAIVRQYRPEIPLNSF
jgi:acetyltransferase-like isoleucine patch superfamily enzyme